MKLCILAYVPPPSRGHPQVFMENVRRFKPGGNIPILFYSDHPWAHLIKISSVEGFKGAKNAAGQVNRFAIPNIVFFTGVRIAMAHGITHFLFLEDDCRVGCDGWAEKMFDEAFSLPTPWIEAGSMVTYNACNFGRQGAIRYTKSVVENFKVAPDQPLPIYGWKGAAEFNPSCVFVNGALGIYNVSWISKLFDLDNTAKVAAQETAYDMAIGIKIWEKFGDRSYDLVQHTHTAYSGYGEVMTTESERMDMLRSGKVVAVHQVKSAQTI